VNKELRILVVEDDPDGQDVVVRILRHYGMTADIVFSGEEALALLAEKSYTAAVVDLALPGMDGWTLLNSIHHLEKTASLPCFAITAYHSAEVALHAIDHGFIAYFPKPLDLNTFAQEIRTRLNT
jgi:CheY-like chemotaxis protein